jgi:threonine/homoserine/homoserine lactone efflux protein
MKKTPAHLVRALIAAGLFLALFSPTELLACATCFGQSDSPLAKGMNAGIFTLLVVVMLMWSAIAAFVVHLIRRSSSIESSRAPRSDFSQALHSHSK